MIRHQTPRILSFESAYTALRIQLGIVLITAAQLQLWSNSNILENESMSYGAIMRAVLSQYEIGLALWLFSGRYPRALWLVTLVTMSTFIAYLLHSYSGTASSCGCFGPVVEIPLVATLVYDGFTTIGFLVLRSVVWRQDLSAVSTSSVANAFKG